MTPITVFSLSMGTAIKVRMPASSTPATRIGSFAIAGVRLKIDNMNHLFGSCDAANCSYRTRSNAMSYEFGKLRRYADHPGGPHHVALEPKKNAKFGIADTDGLLQHRLKDRLQFARRRTNDTQHVGCRRLLLQ